MERTEKTVKITKEKKVPAVTMTRDEFVDIITEAVGEELKDFVRIFREGFCEEHLKFEVEVLTEFSLHVTARCVENIFLNNKEDK